MSKPSNEAVTQRLLAGGFAGSSAPVARLADPIKETPMVLTLDEMAPYDHNPRTTRNPLYDEIKESIRARGLDQPPPVTRRPGEEKFIIRTGGNTRLEILNDLWRETKDERYYRVHCLFRPWSDRGEIVSLTGHLAENDLRGNLMFIERAVHLEAIKQHYLMESGGSLSLREFSRKLKEDGYSISHSHLSKMQEAVRILLPAVPSLLYSGLGKPQIEKILALRSAALQAWCKYKGTEDDFYILFQEVLNNFDGHTDNFVFESIQDELIGQIRRALDVGYEEVLGAILDHQDSSRRSQLVGVQVPDGQAPQVPATSAIASAPGNSPPLEQSPETPSKQKQGAASPSTPPPLPERTGGSGAIDTTPMQHTPPDPEQLSEEERAARLNGHIVTPDGIGQKVRDVQRRIAAEHGETLPDFNSDALRAIPVQAGGLHAISDVWYIERNTDTPEELRKVLRTLVFEIAQLCDVPGELLNPTDFALGFTLSTPQSELTARGTTSWQFLQSLTGMYSYVVSRAPENAEALTASIAEENATFALSLGQLLLGDPLFDSKPASTEGRMTDAAVVKLFRVIRLARRLIELEAGQ
ncbi:ParB family protein [Pseudomonas sp. JUb52]|uniref:ParB family protein n=1 Tax=Pseudomonas sp. JUb52 TaxID=2485127 RepID=UPI0010510326|nr:ParB family protein [Pseudomonas sp. JUb52]TCQ85852.1 ParB family protein of integrating conjugative element (PFGI_1 class) [Pseudomonas sp. JUb52]